MDGEINEKKLHFPNPLAPFGLSKRGNQKLKQYYEQHGSEFH